MKQHDTSYLRGCHVGSYRVSTSFLPPSAFPRNTTSLTITTLTWSRELVMEHILSLRLRIRLLVRVADIQLFSSCRVFDVHDMALGQSVRCLLRVFGLSPRARILQLLRFGISSLLGGDQGGQFGRNDWHGVLAGVRFSLLVRHDGFRIVRKVVTRVASVRKGKLDS